MSLSAHDKQALHGITGSLEDSDPALAGLLNEFTRLTAGQAMPPREQIGISWRRLQGIARRVSRRLGPAGILMIVWVVLAALLVSVAIAVGSGTPARCTALSPLVCPDPGSSAAAHAAQS